MEPKKLHNVVLSTQHAEQLKAVDHGHQAPHLTVWRTLSKVVGKSRDLAKSEHTLELEQFRLGSPLPYTACWRRERWSESVGTWL